MSDAPKGSRWEIAVLAAKLLADLSSIPFHLLVFSFTRGRHKRAFARALQEASA